MVPMVPGPTVNENTLYKQIFPHFVSLIIDKRLDKGKKKEEKVEKKSKVMLSQRSIKVFQA